MATSTLEWEGVLHIREIQIASATIVPKPMMIGIVGNAVVASAGASIPIELMFTPDQASIMLALLMGLHQEGHIPKPHGEITRHANTQQQV